MWDEFQALTLAQLEALEERRAIQIRHARHDAAFIVSAMLNANRAPDMEALTPYDFLPGFEEPEDEREARQRRKEIIRGIRVTFAALGGASAEEVKGMRDKMVARLKVDGHADADEIMGEAFPNL